MKTSRSAVLAGPARRRPCHRLIQHMAKGTLCLSIFATAASSALSAPAVTPLPDDPACTAEDRTFMARAYELAAAATAKGNSAYGALLVKDGKVVMEFSNDAITSKDITHHAETGLMSKASRSLDHSLFVGCTLYTSTEPCIMCCGSIYFSGLKKFVYGVTALQVSKLRGRTLPLQPLQCREVYQRIGGGEVKILGPLMEGQGLAVHAAALALAAPPAPSPH